MKALKGRQKRTAKIECDIPEGEDECEVYAA